MKNKILILALILCSAFFKQLVAQETVGFTINCQIKGLPNGTKIYLRDQNTDTISTAISNNECFSFKGKLLKDGSFHFIIIRNDSVPSKSKALDAIFVENRPISVTGIFGQKKITVTGSPGHDEYQAVITSQTKSSKRVKEIERALLENSILTEKTNDTTLLNSLKLAKEDLIREADIIVSENNQAALKWIANHSSSLYAPKRIIQFKRALSENGIQEAYNKLSKQAKESYYGMELMKELENDKLKTKIYQGAIIPNFAITSVDGEAIRVHDIAAKNKYTLIDVWASWCSPCRSEIPRLKMVYEAYKDKGLNILGISSDSREALWKKALKDDSTTWVHGIEIEGSGVSKLFDLKAIPAYILIDSKGKLIAFDCAMSGVPNFGGGLRGEALLETLEKLVMEGR